MELPPVTIVVTTYFSSDFDGDVRLGIAAKTIDSWVCRLHYDGKFLMHIADDGSDRRLEISGATYSWQNREGYGASMNKGFQKAYESSPIVLHAVDDWALMDNFDITPWVQLLVEREDVGMVRLGPPHPNTRGTVQMLTELWQGWGLRLDRESFAFGTRPALYHKRLTDAYGWFAENMSALECERLYNEKFCTTPGPDIVLALPHPWRHLDSPSLSGMEPK